MVKERAELKTSISRLVCILFFELEKPMPSPHITSVYALPSEFPNAKYVVSAHLTSVVNFQIVNMVKIPPLLSEKQQ